MLLVQCRVHQRVGSSDLPVSVVSIIGTGLFAVPLRL